MSEAKTHRTTTRNRRVRLNKTDTAAQALGPLEPGIEVYCLTYGQFSLIDAIEHLVREAGPCDVAVSTWTAAHADAERARSMLDEGNIRRFRLLVDRSFVSRQPAYCAQVVELFGVDAIRTTKTHAKFATITNDDWTIVVRTSMNLNQPSTGDDRGVRRPGAVRLHARQRRRDLGGDGAGRNPRRGSPRARRSACG